MGMTRRTLLTSLLAVAAAPLAGWRKKPAGVLFDSDLRLGPTFWITQTWCLQPDGSMKLVEQKKWPEDRDTFHFDNATAGYFEPFWPNPKEPA